MVSEARFPVVRPPLHAAARAPDPAKPAGTTFERGPDGEVNAVYGPVAIGERFGRGTSELVSRAAQAGAQATHPGAGGLPAPLHPRIDARLLLYDITARGAPPVLGTYIDVHI